MHLLVHEVVLRSADPGFAAAALLFSDLLAVATVPSVLQQRRGRPASALGWLLALVAIPYLGAAAWWVLGRSHLDRKRRARRGYHAMFRGRAGRPRAPGSDTFSGLLPEPLRDEVLVSDGNDATLLVDGAQAFPAMREAITDAQRSIQALFYIWKPDATGRDLRDLLVERARAGVEVMVLLDGWGSFLLPPGFLRPLREAGARTATFLPLRPWTPSALNFRNHRKLLIVDGEVGFTGGMNVATEYEHTWHDLAVRVRGPAVAGLQDVFFDDWFFSTGELREVERVAPADGNVAVAVLASGPDQWDNRVHDTIFLALTQARRRIWLMTPYFVPGAGILAALRGAAQRGVDVRLLVPKRADVALARLAGRALYPILVDAGVGIWEYGAMLHGKALLVDRDLAIIGSANTDNRSFRLNFELSCAFRSETMTRALEAVFVADLARSTRLDRRSAESEGGFDAVFGSLAQLLAPLL